MYLQYLTLLISHTFTLPYVFQSVGRVLRALSLSSILKLLNLPHNCDALVL